MAHPEKWTFDWFYNKQRAADELTRPANTYKTQSKTNMSNDSRSEFDKGYQAGLMQAYQEVDAWCKFRLDQLQPGKSKTYRDEVDLARVKLLHRLRYYLPAQHFPEVWK